MAGTAGTNEEQMRSSKVTYSTYMTGTAAIRSRRSSLREWNEGNFFRLEREQNLPFRRNDFTIKSIPLNFTYVSVRLEQWKQEYVNYSTYDK